MSVIISRNNVDKYSFINFTQQFEYKKVNIKKINK